MSDLYTILDRNPELTPGQFEAFAALRTRVLEVTADEAVGMTVCDLEDRFDVKDLERFDIERTREIRTILVDYTQAVIDDD